MDNLKDVNVSFNLRTPNIKDKQSAVKCVIRWNRITLTLYSIAKIYPKHFDIKNHMDILEQADPSKLNQI